MENNYAKKIDQSKFKAIKILLNGGATSREAAEYMHVSTATISYIRNSETYEEYKNKIATMSMEKRKAAQKPQETKPQETKPQETKPQTHAPQVMNPSVVRIEATHYMMQKLEETNNLLKIISNKLAFIVDDLYGTGKKEG